MKPLHLLQRNSSVIYFLRDLMERHGEKHKYLLARESMLCSLEQSKGEVVAVRRVDIYGWKKYSTSAHAV
jgi:hypothetical protein